MIDASPLPQEITAAPLSHNNMIGAFRGTHKCHYNSTQVNSVRKMVHPYEKEMYRHQAIHTCYLPYHLCCIFLQCVFEPGKGWARGSYYCTCSKGFYNERSSNFTGKLVEGKFIIFIICIQWRKNY